jgi:hypothetical protein
MLFALLILLAVAVLAPAGVALHSLWVAIPSSNADFQWLDI